VREFEDTRSLEQDRAHCGVPFEDLRQDRTRPTSHIDHRACGTYYFGTSQFSGGGQGSREHPGRPAALCARIVGVVVEDRLAVHDVEGRLAGPDRVK
jgi:hypothetical protein